MNAARVLAPADLPRLRADLSVALLNEPLYKRAYAHASHALGWNAPMTARDDGVVVVPSVVHSKTQQELRDAVAPWLARVAASDLRHVPDGVYMYCDRVPTPRLDAGAHWLTAVNLGDDECMVDSGGPEPLSLQPGDACALPPGCAAVFLFCTGKPGQTLALQRWEARSLPRDQPSAHLASYADGQDLAAVEAWSVTAVRVRHLTDVLCGNKWLSLLV